jgi:hypothetical protein
MPLLLFAVYVLATVIFILAGLTSRPAEAAENKNINFQARVLRASGAVIPDGNVTIQFKIYDADTGGINPWTETQTVPAKNGYVTVSLGASTPFPGTIDWSQELWLTINVNGDGEMNPRMRITAVPYAFRASQANSLTNGASSLSASDLAQLVPGSVQGVNSSNSALRINQQGSGGLLQLQGDGSDVFTVSKTGAVVSSSGITVGNSSSTTAGTMRWTGTDFQGYNGADWVSLTGGNAGVLSGTNVTFTSGLANVGANVTGAAVEMLLFTSATAVSNTAGVTGFTAPADGSFRTCLVKNNAAITGGTLAVRWRVNGVSVGSSACGMDSTTNRQSSSVINSGVVNFSAGDTIGVAFDTVNLAPTTNDFTVYWSVEYTSGAAGGTTLQQAYDNSSAPALITTSNNKDIKVELENTATDSNFLVDIVTGSTGRFAVQDNGTDIFSVDNTGVEASTLTVDNGLTLSNGDLTINSGVLEVVSGGASISGGLDNNSGGITETGSITGVGTNITASGALTVASTGGSSYLTLTSGSGTIVLGASTLSRTAIGTTTLDLIDGSDTTFAINNGGAGLANLTVEGSVTATGFSGSGSALTNLNASNISSGTMGDSYLSSNVALLNLSQNFNQKQTFSAGLTLGNTANATVGNIRWTGSDFEGYDGSGWLSLTSGGSGPGGSGNVVTIIKTSDETVNNSSALQNDDQLKFAVGTNENWTFRYVVKANSGSTPNLKFAVTAPSGATCSVDIIDAEGAVTSSNLGCGSSSGLIVGNGATDTYEIIGSIRNGSTSGNVTLQWAQNSADSSNTTVYTGSYVNAIPATDITGVTSNAFVNGGNAFGSKAIIGTSDSFGIDIVTGGLAALTIDSSGAANFQSSLIVTTDLTVNGSTVLNGIDNNNSGITEAGVISGVGANITATGALEIISTGGANDLKLTSGSGIIVLGASTLSRTAIGSTTIDLVDGSNTILALTNSGAGNANLYVDGTIGIGTTPSANKLSINTPNTADTSAQAIIYTNGVNNKGLVIQSVSSQNANSFEVQNDSGQALVGFDNTGQLILGNDASSAQPGLITFNDTTGSNGFTSVLGTSTLTGNRAISLPDEGGVLCTRNSTACGFLLIGPGSTQTDSSTNSSIFINKTGISGNIATLQKNGTTVLSVLNSGALQLQLTNANAFQVNNSGGSQFFNVDTSGAIVKIGGSGVDATGVILVLDTKNTAGDPSGQNGAMYYNSNRGTFRCYENARGWIDCLGISKPNTRRSTNIIFPGSGTAFNAFGDLATVTASASAAVAATTTNPTMLGMSTANASGGQAHVTSANLNYNSSAKIGYQTYASINANTTARVWLGMTDQTSATMYASANPAGNYASFRYDTGAGDTNWMCVTKDGATQNIQNSGIAPVAGTGYKFEIIIVAGTVVEFRINGNSVCNNTTNLPTANTMLRYVNAIRNLANGVRTLNNAWIYIESDI